MAENKTKATDASVADYLSAIEDEGRRADCRAIAELMTRITEAPARMWGTSIVGFDRYHYKYASGREGDAAVTAFSSRKGDISVYLAASSSDQEGLLARLGRHKMGKSCLYIRKLADVDLGVLEQLVAGSVAEIRRRYCE
jgi:hypothetical protein